MIRASILFLISIFLIISHVADGQNNFISFGKFQINPRLAVDKFSNGEVIPQSKSAADWKKFAIEKKAAWCYYNNDSTFTRYGKFYNFFAVADPRKLCPQGSHVGTKEEWTEIIKLLGGTPSAAKGYKDLVSKTEDEVRKNGFAFLAGGAVLFNGQFFFNGSGGSSFWWTGSSFNSTEGLAVIMECKDSGETNFGHYGNEWGFSVSCINN